MPPTPYAELESDVERRGGKRHQDPRFLIEHAGTIILAPHRSTTAVSSANMLSKMKQTPTRQPSPSAQPLRSLPDAGQGREIRADITRLAGGDRRLPLTCLQHRIALHWVIATQAHRRARSSHRRHAVVQHCARTRAKNCSCRKRTSHAFANVLASREQSRIFPRCFATGSDVERPLRLRVIYRRARCLPSDVSRPARNRSPPIDRGRPLGPGRTPTITLYRTGGA